MTLTGMPRARLVLVVASAAVLVLTLAAVIAPSRAEACSKMHETPFDLHDRATVVAVVRVASVPAPRGRHKVQIGSVRLAVESMIKGTRATTLSSRVTGSSCDAGFRRGKRALVFLDARGDVVGHYEGVIEIGTDDTWPDILRAWGAAPLPTERGALLAKTILADDRRGRDAAWTLTSSPDLLTALDAATVSDLVDHTRRVNVDSMLPVALARLHAVGLTSAMSGRPFTFSKDARALAKVTRFEGIDDPSLLADELAAAQGIEAAAAFDRCERIHQRRLTFSFFDWMSGFDPSRAPAFVEACRTGTPMP
jgi:hypothetical protein